MMYTPGIYNPPNSHYSEIYVPEYVNIGVLIGKNGRHFKEITNETECSYIWYDQTRNVIEIWGPMYSLGDAKTMLSKCFDYFKPDLTLEDLQELINVTASYTRANGQSIRELNGPPWAIHDYLNKNFDKYYNIEEMFKIDNATYWAKIIVQ